MRPEGLASLRRQLEADEVEQSGDRIAALRSEIFSSPSLRASAATGPDCLLAQAAQFFAAADVVRLAAGVDWQGNASEDPRSFVARGQARLKLALEKWRRGWAASFPPGWLVVALTVSAIPLIEMLDRLDSRTVVPLELATEETWPKLTDAVKGGNGVTLQVAWPPSQKFWMHVLPTRSIEANHVRGLRRFHCDGAFMQWVLERRGMALRGAASRSAEAAPALPGFFVVEVGAHLGGCSFYALTHLDAASRGLAIEPYRPAAEAMRRTAEGNGLGGRLEVLQKFVSDDGSRRAYRHVQKPADLGRLLQQPDWNDALLNSPSASPAAAGGQQQPSQQPLARGEALEALLSERHVQTVDVLRVHVLGRELMVLRSARRYFQVRAIKAVAVAIFGKADGLCERQDAGAIGRYLREHGFHMRFGSFEDDEAQTQLESICKSATSGTMTLLAALEM
eukprot:TRINITY_DN34096_c0_g1_i1.p1 TRINITY_DN34096_c0_g1~~TRINITY_DN34096_c0_g1_i1.p1  ORF type:complete len:508 (+),score=106.37 TRINITY_DN34096_c0_g1_i1:174-1526(+)